MTTSMWVDFVSMCWCRSLDHLSLIVSLSLHYHVFYWVTNSLEYSNNRKLYSSPLSTTLLQHIDDPLCHRTLSVSLSLSINLSVTHILYTWLHTAPHKLICNPAYAIVYFLNIQLLAVCADECVCACIKELQILDTAEFFFFPKNNLSHLCIHDDKHFHQLITNVWKD